MTLGQRIKEARLEKQLTQQELVGEYITRNMLSKIENDSATPSVRTLEYLADRLGLSPGEFLSDDAPHSENGIDELEKLLDGEPDEFFRRLPAEKRKLQTAGQRLLLLEAEALLNRGDRKRAEALLEGEPPEDASLLYRHLLLRGRLRLMDGQLDQARLLLMQAEKSAPPRADLIKLYGLLEKCCRELGDFENAYLYATRQRGL